VLRTFHEKFGDAVPRHWVLERRLVQLFVEQTRAMFYGILSSGEPQEVTVILKALQKSLVFEKECQARFDDEDHRLGPPGDATTTTPKGGGSSGEATPTKTATTLRPSVLGALSSVFDGFMGGYVELERKNMEDMMSKVAADEDVDRDGALPVLSSSVQMFAYIKTSVRRCTALTTGGTFLTLHKAFCDCLVDYARRLKESVDDAGEGSSDGKQQRQLKGVAGADAVASACYVLNTAEYCAETVEQLGDIVRGKIDKAYVGQVDMDREVEAFHDVVARAVKRLVRLLDVALEPALKTVAATPWGALDIVDEESPYVRGFAKALKQKIPVARALLSPLYFKNFCDKVAASFLPKFYAALFVGAQRRINEMATHQLLLDLHSVKPLMLDLHNLKPLDEGFQDPSAADDKSGSNKDASEPTTPGGGGPGGSPRAVAHVKPPATYVKFVTKHLAKIEMVLKLVGTPTEMLVERFKIMWPDGSRQDLVVVCGLKGLKKAEQQHLLDTFGGPSGVPDHPAADASRSRSEPPVDDERSGGLEAKLESVSATASFTIGKVGSSMRDFISTKPRASKQQQHS